MADPNEANTQPEGIESHIGELLEGYMPPADTVEPAPEADPKPVESQPEGELKPGEVKPEGEVTPAPEEGEPEPAAEAPKPPDAAVKTYEYRGKQYTVDQMIELGILDDALQTARQFPTIQTKYQQLLEQARLQPAPAGQPGQPAPQAHGPSAEQILTAYTPVMQQSADQGFIEKEAYEAFPRLVSALMFHRDLLYDVRKAVAAIMQRSAETEGVSQKATFLNYLDTTCDKVGGQGEHFALIKDPTVRKGFYEYLATLNTPANEVDENFVKRQWVAYNSEPILEAARGLAATRKAEDKTNRRNAAGEGGGPRPAPAAKVVKTEDAKMIDTFLDGDKRFSTGG